jgi:putative tricarboxylic transport membrane protein
VHPGDQRLRGADIRRSAPDIMRSAVIGAGIGAAIGTVIGALPGIGSAVAATLGHRSGAHRHGRRNLGATPFGQGAPEGIAASEAANCAVSGANLIPVLSLGIAANAAAVFVMLAAESIGGLTPGPSVFRFSTVTVNPELVITFGLFTAMMVANLLTWTIGGMFMGAVGVFIGAPKHVLLPIILVMTLTAISVQEARMPPCGSPVGSGRRAI